MNDKKKVAEVVERIYDVLLRGEGGGKQRRDTLERLIETLLNPTQ